MKKIINLLLAVAVFLCATSCITSNEVDTSIYTDCAITSFSINDIETTVTATNQYGGDSTYTVTVTGSDVVFTIDHLKREIYNNDSLPKGTNVRSIICTVNADGNVIYKNNNYDSSKTDSQEWGTTKDSIDFTKPVTFRVQAYNGEDFRDYLVHLNVHKVTSSDTQWDKMATSYPGAQLEKPRAVPFGKKVAVFGMKDNKLQVTVADNGGQNWSDLTPVQGLTDQAQFTETTVFGNRLYMADAKQLMVSEDGINWRAEAANADFSHLLGSNSIQLFAVTEGKFIVSTDGKNWDEEETEYPEMMPDRNIYNIHYTTSTNAHIERTILAGQISESNDSIAPVWYRQGQEPWSYMHVSANKAYFLPNLENMVILYYKEYLLAFGGKKLNTKYPGKALSHFYVSIDNGLTWKIQEEDEKYTYPALPEDLEGNEHPFAAYVDDDMYIWILFSETGEVWRGRYNSIVF